MSRYNQNIEVARKYAASWLKKQGWEPVPDPKMPFVPAKWRCPKRGDLMSLESAVEIQMIYES